MNPYLMLPFALGVSVVVQATLNRSMGLQYGLAAAVTLNAAIFLVLSLGFFAIAKYTPSVVPEFWRIRESHESFSPWYVLPGICGFILVIGLPWSIEALGPSLSFLLLVSSQIVISLILEFSRHGMNLSPTKIFGAAFVILGAILAIKK